MKEDRTHELVGDPKYYRKKIKLRPEVLREIPEQEQNALVDDINRQIQQDYGDFGNLVDVAKHQLIEGFDKKEYLARVIEQTEETDKEEDRAEANAAGLVQAAGREYT